MAEWLINGTASPWVSVSERALQYGDGLFETVAIRNGEPRFWRYHLERLSLGCERLQIAVPARDELLQDVMQALNSARKATATVKIIVTAGSGKRGYDRRFVASPGVMIGVFTAVRQAASAYREGVQAMLCDTRLATGSVTAGLKTLNRLEQVIARSELHDTSCFEGFTLDAAGNIICGTMSNVFFVTDSAVVTPSLQRCGVAGVMRRHVIETLRQAGTAAELRDFPVAELDQAREVFLSNSQFGVLPVRSCGDRQWPVGDVTRDLMQTLAADAVPECCP